MSFATDTITAPATAMGRAGIGIIRISGPKTKEIAIAILGQLPQARFAHYAEFKDQNNQVIDLGIALFYPQPNSFTGEDVLELHGHGGPVIMDILMQRIMQLGARYARAGEFSERAFLNNKIDLAQAEAIADVIDAGSSQAARAAVHSLQGVFSQKIQDLLDKLIQLRMYVEAAIDFPEEEIDFLNDTRLSTQCTELCHEIDLILNTARQGVLLRDGITIVIAGEPNAGKSSLLNQLSGRESAIVTDIAGTTRDLLREYIQIDGIPLHIIDTAGLRESHDPIEREGMRRAREAISQADRVLLLIDAQKPLPQKIPMDHPRLTLVSNKIDLAKENPTLTEFLDVPMIKISAKTGAGINLLKQHLKQAMGYDLTSETGFSARRRHLDALMRAKEAIQLGRQQLQQHRAGELLAEELRKAQQSLGEITGDFTSEDLLSRIFASFCIGK